MLPTTPSSGPASRLSTCKNNLKQIDIALHNYADTYDAFPPAYTVDADGNRLHSWRTLLLPYMDQAPLYKQIDLSKPWDDPANAAAFKTIIPGYRCPSADSAGTHTTYLAVVAPNSCIHPTKPRPFSEITDSFGETLMVIEVDPEDAVHWMSPMDADETLVLGARPESALPHEDGMHALFADGSVQFLSAETPTAKRRALISIDGDDK
jgi:prepilin-type processing-associated H-X9-DG protein